ncbi:efflux transporter periplasmic adaptor subunit [Achromobacter sp. HZ01]|uniref:efflux RND transporter periplasmic adaptor subunit n=1 Tax=Achromobacter sp. HZ01 TaxID=1416886 RepID=UPI000DC4980E|nr:efflux RND transporter periplasmic adaptor subunit [Achromobacter sp. HZ01]RAP62276.1 efflux transporter periplasmic adaptor subunit [Achromobacter sp. HZ01]
MNPYDKRLIRSVIGAVLLAGAGGFALARYTAPAAAVAGSAPAAAAAAAAEPVPADSLAMSEEAIREAGITTEVLRAGGLQSEINAQAIVAPQPGGEAVVTARAAGAVTQVLKRLGDPVQAGEALAVVASRDAAQLAAARTAANARAELARKNLAREQYLYKQQVSARVDLEQAQAEARAAAADARRAQVEAEVANVTKDGQGVAVASPIDGRITAQSASLGAYVQPDAELFRIADPRKIQVEAAILPGDAARIAAGDRAVVELPGNATLEAQVRSVTPSLNSATRQATAVIDVAAGSLQPGLAVRVRIFPEKKAASAGIVIPEEAVQTLEGKDAVFIRTAEGFKARFVTIGPRSAGRIEVAKGLSAGETIATGQAFLLKAELAKGAGEEE